MISTIRMRAGLRFSALLLVLSLSIALSTSCFAEKESTDAQMPDVLVWIDARNPDGHWVSITYPSVVPRDKAKHHLDRLLAETGWKAADVNISDGSVMESGENPMTSVELLTPQAVQLESGVLPVEPIIKALKDLKRIEMQYLVQPGFSFQGPVDHENKYVKISLEYGTNTYRYSILVKDSDFESLNLPLLRPQAESEGRNGSGPGPLAMSLIVILALLTAFIAYVITSRLTSRNGQRPD